MKVFLFLVICSLQQMYSSGSLLAFMGLDLGPECITLSQIYKATEVLCKQERKNKDLWKAVIECHRPIDDTFLRASGEAQCPLPINVADSNNTKNAIEDVFFNICGIVEGSWTDFFWTGKCIIGGQSDPYIMSHKEEVARVKLDYGKDVPCNIGKCILDLNLL